MSDMTRHVILNHVDSPLKILVWTTGELGLFLMPLFLGLFFNQLLLGVLVSFTNYRLFRIYRDRFGKDQFPAVCYWFLPPSPQRYPALPPSYVRHYIG